MKILLVLFTAGALVCATLAAPSPQQAEQSKEDNSITNAQLSWDNLPLALAGYQQGEDGDALADAQILSRLLGSIWKAKSQQSDDGNMLADAQLSIAGSQFKRPFKIPYFMYPTHQQNDDGDANTQLSLLPSWFKKPLKNLPLPKYQENDDGDTVAAAQFFSKLIEGLWKAKSQQNDDGDTLADAQLSILGSKFKGPLKIPPWKYRMAKSQQSDDDERTASAQFIIPGPLLMGPLNYPMHQKNDDGNTLAVEQALSKFVKWYREAKPQQSDDDERIVNAQLSLLPSWTWFKRPVKK